MSRRRASHDPLFDEPESKPWGKYALGAAIVGVAGFILYAAFVGGSAPQGPVPVIRADETPWTRAPSDAGGMEIPNQDSMVYELMEKPEGAPDDTATTDAAAPDVKTEAVPPTEVQTMDEVMKAAVGDESVDKTVDKDDDKAVDVIGAESADISVDENADKPLEEEVKVSEDQTVEKSEDKTEDVSADKSVDTQAEKSVEKIERDPALDAPYDPKKAPIASVAGDVSSEASAPGGKTVQVRLGSVPGTDMAKANAEFTRLKSLSGGQLTGSAMMEPVTLDKGSFIRINATMSAAQARALCDTLSSKGAPCVVLGQ